jgi:protein involved in polysaccharide export with SLBB domain
MTTHVFHPWGNARQRLVPAALVAAAFLLPGRPLAAQSAVIPLDQVVPAEATTGLRPGDAIRITVWRRAELSGEFEIADDGSVRHPLYRSVQVRDISFAELDERLRVFLSGFEANPQFIVEPLFRVLVAGEVRQPNLYLFGAEITLAQAVARAGSATERGRSDRVRLIRDGRETVIDLSRGDAAPAQLRVRSGDQIVVERRRSILREYVVPFATLTGAAAALVTAIARTN